MANQMVSLAYYVFRAKKAGATGADLSAMDVPYWDLLAHRVNLPQAAELWSETHEPDDALVPLAEIDLDQADYLDIVTQIYNGIALERDCSTTSPSPSALRAFATIPRMGSLPIGLRV